MAHGIITYFPTPTICPSTPATILRPELIPPGTGPDSTVLASPSGRLELGISEAVSQARASEDEYRPSLDDGNIGGVKALPRVIV